MTSWWNTPDGQRQVIGNAAGLQLGCDRGAGRARRRRRGCLGLVPLDAGRIRPGDRRRDGRWEDGGPGRFRPRVAGRPDSQSRRVPADIAAARIPGGSRTRIPGPRRRTAPKKAACPGWAPSRPARSATPAWPRTAAHRTDLLGAPQARSAGGSIRLRARRRLRPRRWSSTPPTSVQCRDRDDPLRRHDPRCQLPLQGRRGRLPPLRLAAQAERLDAGQAPPRGSGKRPWQGRIALRGGPLPRPAPRGGTPTRPAERLASPPCLRAGSTSTTRRPRPSAGSSLGRVAISPAAPGTR